MNLSSEVEQNKAHPQHSGDDLNRPSRVHGPFTLTGQTYLLMSEGGPISKSHKQNRLMWGKGWFVTVWNDNVVIRSRYSIWPGRPQQVLDFSASRRSNRNMYGLSPRVGGGGSRASMKTTAGLCAL